MRRMNATNARSNCVPVPRVRPHLQSPTAVFEKESDRFRRDSHGIDFVSPEESRASTGGSLSIGGKDLSGGYSEAGQRQIRLAQAPSIETGTGHSQTRNCSLIVEGFELESKEIPDTKDATLGS